MKPVVFLGFFLFALASARADVPVPAPTPSPSDEIGFDEEFLSGLVSPVFDAGQIDGRIARRFARRAIRKARAASKDGLSHSAIFLEIFDYFVNYAREFDRNIDKGYSTIGDFRAAYQHQLGQRPWLSLQVEAFRASTENETHKLQTEGGGAGVRVDLKSAEKGNFTFMFMPLYGERRSIRTVQGVQVGQAGQSAWDGILRTSVGGAYTYTESEVAQPGVQVLYQPQLIDLGQFRVYAEAFVRLRIKRSPKGNDDFWAVSEVNLVPKIIYWKANDEGGLIGDDVNAQFGDALGRLKDQFYAFCNVEFRFRR